MKEIMLKEFIKIIDDSTEKKENSQFHIREYKNNIFSVQINREALVHLNVLEENKYDVLFETLKKAFNKRHRVIWSHDIYGKHEAYIIIDEKVIIDLDYNLLEGQTWLQLHYK